MKRTVYGKPEERFCDQDMIVERYVKGGMVIYRVMVSAQYAIDSEYFGKDICAIPEDIIASHLANQIRSFVNSANTMPIIREHISSVHERMKGE